MLIKNQQQKEVKGENMEDKTFSIKALAALMHMTIKDLAEATGISYNHLRLVSCGDATMTGDDLLRLHKFTGVPTEQIEVTPKKN